MLRLQRAFAALAMLLGCWQSPAAVPLESLKAAFLYNFALFVDWPTMPKGEFNLCLVGGEPFAAADTLAGKKVGAATVHVRRPSKVDDLRACHLLYLGGPDHGAIERARASVENAPVLTVADAIDAGRNAAMISLVTEEGHLAFDIDMHAASRVGIRISSRLLRLARKIY